ncbi:MAG: 3'-5' exonuclease [bacterium]|nr:3'-5' exonuclease [bacterium]
MLGTYTNKRDLVFVDLETNGLDTDTAILEIAALRYTAGQFTEKASFEYLIRFDGVINPSAAAVHKIDSESLRMYGRDIKEVLGLFVDFSSEAILIGHNIINFDLRILNYHLWRHELSLSCIGVLDTKRIAERLLTLPSYRLEALARHFGVIEPSYHRAMADVRATAGVFQGLLRSDA